MPEKKIRLRTPVTLFLVLVLFISFKPLNESFIKILDRLDYLIHYFPQEKIYVFTDKSHYIISDTIWFSVKATDASFHEKDPLSGLVYVQLINPDGVVVQKLNIQLNEKNANGDFVLAEDLIPGRYTIEAFTQYMLNYDPGFIFSKEIMVWEAAPVKEDERMLYDKKDSLNLQIKFYPEGGDIIENISTLVAFEALTEDGQPAETNIQILDQNGQPVVQSRTLHDGMGFFSLKGSASQSYFAEVQGKKFPLPPVKEKGYSIKVVNRFSDNFSVSLESNIANGLEGTFLIGHLRGQVFFAEEKLKGNIVSFKIDKSELPSGVAQFTLFSKSGIPLCERTLFIYNKNEIPVVQLNLPYAYQLPRSPAKASFQLTDLNNFPLEGEFSVSISDVGKIPFTRMEQDISSFFLLTSDLTSHLRNPGFYFNEMTFQKHTLLDMAMLVHGWTRIKSEVLDKDYEPTLSFAPEKGFSVTGTVLRKGKAMKGAKVDLAIMDGDFFITETITNENGRFAFYDVPVHEGQTMHLKAYESIKKGKKTENTRDIELMLDKSKSDLFVKSYQYPSYFDGQTFDFKRFLEESLERRRVDSLYTPLAVNLDNVTIVARKVTRDAEIKKKRAIIYPNYNTRIELDSLPFVNPAWNIFEMVAYLTPGAQLVGQRPSGQSIRFRGGLNSLTQIRPAMIMLDGVPVSPEFASSIDIYNIEFFDVLRSMSSTAIFGSQADGGVVALYSRLGTRHKDRVLDEKFKTKLTFNGYYQTREFYTPAYGSGHINSSKPDLRSTLYWAPQIKTDNQGNAEIIFSTGDIKSEFLINIQGMTYSGQPFSIYKTFEVR